MGFTPGQTILAIIVIGAIIYFGRGPKGKKGGS
jgi:hypothetical protein